jgi:signal transduction histidine kinase
LVTFAALLAGTVFLAHHLRVAFLLRLERQRLRIAMDLHDEIGSGLGSIRILAGLANDPAQPEPARSSLLNDIAEAAGELGASLGEMVWSLRARSGTLEGLVSHLTERAARFFPGETPAFAAEIPDTLPPVELSLAVRRNVALIALEALHNAARHSGASRVVLGLVPVGRRWKLWVSDDGRGFDSTGSGSPACATAPNPSARHSPGAPTAIPAPA